MSSTTTLTPEASQPNAKVVEGSDGLLLGGSKPEVVTIGEDLLPVPTTVVRVEAGAPRPIAYSDDRAHCWRQPRDGRFAGTRHVARASCGDGEMAT